MNSFINLIFDKSYIFLILDITFAISILNASIMEKNITEENEITSEEITSLK